MIIHRSGSQENSPLLGRFCGSTSNKEIVSMTNQMYIKFVSDSSLQDAGFELDWRSTKTGTFICFLIFLCKISKTTLFYISEQIF